jgi:hypothetical protein
MADMKEFVQMVKVHGAEEAMRQLRELGVDTENLGKETKEAGEQGQKAAGKFGGLNPVLDSIRKGALGMIASFGGMTAVTQLFREFYDVLVQIDLMQKAMAEKTVSLAEASKEFAAQTGMSEQDSIRTVSGLAEKGGLDYGAAKELGKTMDIVTADTGGIRNEKNLRLAEIVAPFVGANALDGDAVTALLNFLQTTGQLGSPEQLKTALSKITATSGNSSANTVGEFATQLNANATRLQGANIGFERQLQIGAVAIGGTAGNAAEAATATQTLLSLAGGSSKEFNKVIDSYAKSEGMDARSLTRADRLDLIRKYVSAIDTPEEEKQFFSAVAPEQALRVHGAFGAVATGKGRAAIDALAAAESSDFESSVSDYQGTVRFRAASDAAAQDAADAIRGAEVFPLQHAKEQAGRFRQRDLSRGEGTWDELIMTDEAVIERRAQRLLRSQLNEARGAGVDTSAAEALQPRAFNPYSGYSDSAMEK